MHASTLAIGRGTKHCVLVTLAMMMIAAASVLMPAHASAATTLGPSPNTITAEATSAAVAVEFDIEVNSVTDLTGWEFYLHNPAAGPTVANVTAGAWWNTAPEQFYPQAHDPGDTNFPTGGYAVLGYTSDGSGKTGNGALAHVTVSYGGAAPGSYVFTIDHQELVDTAYTVIPTAVTSFTLVIEAAQAPQPDSPVLAIAGKTTSSIAMQCSECTDRTAPVRYQFNRGTPSPGTTFRDWSETRSTEETGLTANSQHTYRARAKDSTAEENTTGWSPDVTAYTLPVAPSVSCDRAAPGQYPVDTLFTFTNDAGWGEGALDHCHYLWSKQATHTFTGTEPAWSAATLPLTADSSGNWYLHVMSHNPDHDSGGTQTHGPYNVGDLPNPPSDFAHSANTLDSITWSWADNSDNETGFRIDPPVGNAPANETTWTETSLASNTAYTRHVTAYNIYGDSAPSNGHTAYTSIEQPSGITFGTVTTSAIQARAANTPSNLASGASGLIVRNTTHATDSGWKQDNDFWNSTGLTANKAYALNAEARNGDGDLTGPCADATKWTLPVAPDVACDRSVAGHHPTGTVFTFTNSAGWGEGALDHCHYVWSKLATHTFTGTETAWGAAALPLAADSAGDWYLHVMSHNGEHASGGSLVLGPYDVGDLPAAPSNFTHTGNTLDSITWSWADNSDNETGFRIDPPAGIAAADATTWTETSLAVNTAYTRHVTAYNIYGDSAPSNGHTAYTSIETPTGVSFGAVANVSIELNASGTLSNLASGASGVFFDETGGSNAGINQWMQAAADTATGLTPNTQYTFQVKARNGDGDETPYSPTSQKHTLASQPGDEDLSNITSQSIQANWNAGAPVNPEGTLYLVECYAGDGFGGTKIAESGWTPTLAHLFGDLDPNAQYSFRVKAKNGEDVETAWTLLGSPYTLPNSPGALTIDMQVKIGAVLNLTAPGCRSLTLISIGLNGNPDDTLIAIKAASNWLRFVPDGNGHTDAYPDGPAEEWHTAAEWAGKRIRGLTPDTAYIFQAKAKNATDHETELVGVGTYSTNKDGDVLRDGTTSVLDLLHVRGAVLTGGQIGVHYSWATDINDDEYRRTDISDIAAVRVIILNP